MPFRHLAQLAVHVRPAAYRQTRELQSFSTPHTLTNCDTRRWPTIATYSGVRRRPRLPGTMPRFPPADSTERYLENHSRGESPLNRSTPSASSGMFPSLVQEISLHLFGTPLGGYGRHILDVPGNAQTDSSFSFSRTSRRRLLLTG